MHDPELYRTASSKASELLESAEAMTQADPVRLIEAAQAWATLALAAAQPAQRNDPPIEVKTYAAAGQGDLDSEVIGTDGEIWHQDGPDSAHERSQCDPTVCGWRPRTEGM